MKKTILLWIFAVCAVTAAEAQVSESDFKALRAIYDALGGKFWNTSSGWDFSGTADGVKAFNKETGEGWYGINEISKGRVSKLELQKNNLVGELPDAIYDLTGARTINLSGNRITGQLSPRIGGLTRISSFNLSENQLSGEIPAQIVDLGKDASSRAPQEGKSGTEIKVLLNKNQFSGAIPENIGAMSLLNKPAKSITLDLSSNQLTGELPASLLQLTGLTSFRAAFNQLTGTVPAGLADLPKLQYLRLEKNKFTGEVPQKK